MNLHTDKLFFSFELDRDFGELTFGFKPLQSCFQEKLREEGELAHCQARGPARWRALAQLPMAIDDPRAVEVIR